MNLEVIKLINITVIFFISSIVLGCSSSTYEIKETDKSLTSIHWSNDHLYKVSQAMVKSILKSDILDNTSKKVFTFSTIDNDTYDHIDTNSIIEMIKIGLLASEKVSITNNESEAKGGVFSGRISAIYQKNSLCKDMLIVLELTLKDKQTNKTIWKHQAEIRKKNKKSLIGW